MLISPTLDLFSYDIRESLGLSEAEIDKNRQYFKSRLPAELGQIIDKFDAQGDYVELLGQTKIHRFEEDFYTGYYYPLRLNDSYGLLLDCSCRDTQSSDNLHWISGLKQCIEQKSAQKPTLGQTWVFYASVLNIPSEDYDLIAQKCYRALLPDANWYQDKTGSSEFTGGKLFELWQEGGEMSHVVIILFSNEQIAGDLMPKLIQDELRWFWYRHKITWAYNQSQCLKSVLKTKSVDIDRLLEDFYGEKFDSAAILKRANISFRYYLELINDLATQVPTIETNLLNYRKLTGKLAQSLPGLNFPNEFERRTTERYLIQIQRDYATFTLQLDLIKNLVASIQAQETHDSVNEIVSMQRKVEWLEVFFASYYACALTYYLASSAHFDLSYKAISVFLSPIIIGLLVLFSLGLKPNRYQWLVIGLVIMFASIWLACGIMFYN